MAIEAMQALNPEQQQLSHRLLKWKKYRQFVGISAAPDIAEITPAMTKTLSRVKFFQGGMLGFLSALFGKMSHAHGKFNNPAYRKAFVESSVAKYIQEGVSRSYAYVTLIANIKPELRPSTAQIRQTLEGSRDAISVWAKVLSEDLDKLGKRLGSMAKVDGLVSAVTGFLSLRSFHQSFILKYGKTLLSAITGGRIKA